MGVSVYCHLKGMTNVTGVVKRGLIHAIINIQKYIFEIFNSIYLEND